MARVFKTAVALVLLCGVAAHASRVALEEDFSSPDFIGRGLLQRQLDCKKVHFACSTCRNQRKAGSRVSELVCSQCQPTFRLRRDGISKTCDCAPGFVFNAVTKTCDACPAGKYCLGGDKTNPDSTASDCPIGLATTFAGAKSQQQCFTQAGYGRKAERGTNGVVNLVADVCPKGSYNVGGNTAGCQKCPAGLTTAAAQTTAPSDCLAPAGSYVDKGIGKLCPKGTYSIDLNSNSACTACPPGITTADEGSDSAADCQFAKRGFYMTDATTALPCPVNTYNDGETLKVNEQCFACPNGWKTKVEGADGQALCLAPPGYELKAGANAITPCDMGSYKADWNRNNCTVCGTGLITAATASVSKDACLVPAGWGIATLTPDLTAQVCVQSQYGQSEDRPASAAARCQTCPQNMGTMDAIKAGEASPANGYTDETDCKVKPGWGLTPGGLAEVCPKGFYNAGYNRLQCQACPAGYTTLDVAGATAGATSANDCVIQPGWYMQTTVNGTRPAPCDVGTWSAGGDATTREPTSCTDCAVGYSTQTDESTSADDCAVCAAGYGGDNCVQCGYDTFSFGGQKAGIACTACAAGSASRKRSTEAAMCYSKLQDCVADVFIYDGTWAPITTATSSTECQAACVADETCITYRWYLGQDSAVNKCDLVKSVAGGTQELYFKLNNGADYVKRTIGATEKFGEVVATPTVADRDACLTACKSTGDCEVASWKGTQCSLLRSELEQDYSGMWVVNGKMLISDPTA